MRIRTMFAASVLAVTAVCGGAGAAAADDDGFSLVKDVSLGCVISVPLYGTDLNESCPEGLPGE
ncbi:hypothetical protein J7I98_39225 [Streptomyces sp. ISL-98]|uniref:hypothetical protein n=1 Tax=Streptomyces sp. ISL-98 TaxID=2819192 RepID=UPI001BE8B77A|nr:hypothetical protein [Streptomyces sp. ISL-98]MBT2511708.1 hypothetical protein [Streptomyces sp. ISL-98]